MKVIDIDPILQHIEETVKRHELSTGHYCRYLWQDRAESREMGLNAYGCADAANILYTLNRFPQDPVERAQWVAALQSKQDPQTGIFLEPTHHDFHTTAHCVAALELFDARPLYPLTAMAEYRDITKFFRLMEDADWLHKGCMAHAGAGLFAALVITDTVDNEWVQQYFDWFNKNCDPASGMWVQEPAPAFPVAIRMGDAFHYLFNYDYYKQPIPYPEQLIDSCLAMYRDGNLPEGFGRQFHYIEMDWSYCLNRATRQTPHRFHEVKETLYELAVGFTDFLNRVNWEKDDSANDLHLLFGVTCCLAELQLALPGLIHSSKPMRLTLDRRPFI